MFGKLFDVIFPPSEEVLLIREALDEALLSEMRMTHVRENVSALLPFSHSLVRACIHEAKFYGNVRAQKMLGVVLAAYLKTETRTCVLIPVPLSRARVRERGYNQVELVVRQALAGLQTDNLSLCTDVLIRTRHTKPQTDLSRETRLTNVQNAFGLKANADVAGKHVFLIDDVVTTGATLQAAKAALLPLSPASVTCIALAH